MREDDQEWVSGIKPDMSSSR